jgi:hypothetical protein
LKVDVSLSEIGVRRERVPDEGVSVGRSRPRHRTQRHHRVRQRQTHGFRELHARHREVSRGRDLPLAHVRPVHVDGENIRLGDEADLAACASTLAIALRRINSRVRRSCRRLELKHLYECLCRTERQALSGGITARAGRLTFQRRRLHAEVRESRVEDPLLERDGGPVTGSGWFSAGIAKFAAVNRRCESKELKTKTG